MPRTPVDSRTSLPLISRAEGHGGRTAVVAPEGVFCYDDLLKASAVAAVTLLAGAPDLAEARVAFLVPPGWDYVVAQWAIWRAGGVAVPLAVSHPPAELEYVVDDTGATLLIAHPKYEDALAPIAQSRGIPLISTDRLAGVADAPLPSIAADRMATILYTSGSTGKPKGVVATHRSIQAQVETLVDAWGWSADDRILNVLPLHHVHGIINAMACALWAGATCELLPHWDAERVWERLGSGDLTLFMGVPTIYGSLISEWDNISHERRTALTRGVAALRLMVCGSDALPVATLERWREITGHTLLERYGMTEIGMALSNALDGERVPGHVGTPLPGVSVRLVEMTLDEETGEHTHGAPVAPGKAGEIQVRGPSVFREYWGRPDATREAFDDDGWFCSGDVASIEDGQYRIWGRASQDIIITGGENVSAREVEQVLTLHPDVEKCAVVGVKDPRWGKAVSAAVVVTDGAQVTRESLREWARDRLAPYKLPQRVITLDALPTNAMGKVVKPRLVEVFQGTDANDAGG
jgi:malonyl-CoA/methylmalonyl-CoA synthetase